MPTIRTKGPAARCATIDAGARIRSVCVRSLCCLAFFGSTCFSFVGFGSALAGEDDILGPPTSESLPTVSDGRFVIPEIAAVSTSTQPIGNGSTPDGFRGDATRPISPLPELASERAAIGQDAGLGSDWNWSVTHWDAANTFSNPRYFEDVMLERHGHERWGHLQPIASGMRFFTTIPMLPYKMAIKPPCDCEYTMGYYRTGSRTPGFFQRPPWDRKAILAEAAAVATGMLILP